MIELSHLAINSPVSYLIALLLPAFDALIPILPSETAIITLGVATAGSTDPRIAVLVALAAAGAFLGDNLTYQVGRWLGPWIERRVFSGEKGAKRRAWAENALEHYGARIIIACRFVPGGRTAVTLTCGLIGYSRRTFIAATAVAGVIWACYAFFIGRLGGQAFESRPWAGLLLAFAVALAVSLLIELARRMKLWQRISRLLGRPAKASTAPATRQEAATDGSHADGDHADGAASPRPHREDAEPDSAGPDEADIPDHPPPSSATPPRRS
jgi:membrane protein DedA with SNARE-associated domain